MKTNLSGIVAGIDNETYHAMGEYLSSTGLREFAKSPAHYQAYRASKKPPTKSMPLGTNFHELVGEPQLFAKKYAKMPSPSLYKDLLLTIADMTAHLKAKGFDGKLPKAKPDMIKLVLEVDPAASVWDNIVASFANANEGKVILSSDDFDTLDGMLAAVINNKTALALLQDGQAEQSVFWTDPATGVKLKCRPDYLRSDGVIVDLKKTAKGADAKSFQRAIGDYKYHIQSELYLQGTSHALGEPLTNFVHLVVEEQRPHGIGIFTLDDPSLLKAREEISVLLERFAECSAKNEWPGYVDEIQNISIPAWMY